MGIFDKVKTKKPTKAAASTSSSAPVEKKKKASGKNARREDHQIIVRPFVSEKAAMATGDSNVYTFVVTMNANKVSIKEAVHALYGVRPTTVRITRMHGKNVRFGGREGKRSDWKKAMVTLPKGTTINVHQGV
jgi:large subunit ribosomal protein L23